MHWAWKSLCVNNNIHTRSIEVEISQETALCPCCKTTVSIHIVVIIDMSPLDMTSPHLPFLDQPALALPLTNVSQTRPHVCCGNLNSASSISVINLADVYLSLRVPNPNCGTYLAVKKYEG